MSLSQVKVHLKSNYEMYIQEESQESISGSISWVIHRRKALASGLSLRRITEYNPLSFTQSISSFFSLLWGWGNSNVPTSSSSRRLVIFLWFSILSNLRTWLADIRALYDEECYQKYFAALPAFRQEKARKLLFQKDRAQSAGAWLLLEEIRKRYKISDRAVYNLSPLDLDFGILPI